MNPSNPILGKSLSNSASFQLSTPSGTPTANGDFVRRLGPNPHVPSVPQTLPRKNQVLRKQHRSQRRPAMGERGNSSPLDRDDAIAEMRAVRNPSSRRGQTSITHLLNYTAPRSFQDHANHARSYRRHPTWGPGSGYHAIDKARYVHANYRFVVNPTQSYSKQAADADEHLEWSSVLQVIASAESQAASCPICLSDPVAPRMARCGHIFCLPCAIRFMSSVSTDEENKSGKGARWKKCPICEDVFYLHEMRPVRFYAGQESTLPRIGDDVILRLMARHSNSTLALPREGGAEAIESGDDVPWHFAANVLDFARIMKGSRDYMNGQFDEEIEALTAQQREDEALYGQDAEWTQRAIRAVNSNREKVAEIASIEQANPQSAQSSRSTTKQPSSADFYFYSSPPHLYLSPLDIRILKTKYGSFSSFPSTLLPRVEHISTGHVVDDLMRKRAKYLGHLPHGCVISFLECDWTDIVPGEVLASFTADITKRRMKNREKAAQEERERLDAERIEAAAIRGSAISQTPVGSLEEDRVPLLDISEFQPLNSGTTPPDSRPGFETLASMSTSPSTQKTVWGTRALQSSPEVEPSNPGDLDDGWLKEDDFLTSAELATEMDALQVMEESIPDTNGFVPQNNVGSGKRKKKQKITLMSTGGRRGL